MRNLIAAFREGYLNAKRKSSMRSMSSGSRIRWTKGLVDGTPRSVASWVTNITVPRRYSVPSSISR